MREVRGSIPCDSTFAKMQICVGFFFFDTFSVFGFPLRATGLTLSLTGSRSSHVGTMYLMLMNASSPPYRSKSCSVSSTSSPTLRRFSLGVVDAVAQVDVLVLEDVRDGQDLAVVRVSAPCPPAPRSRPSSAAAAARCTPRSGSGVERRLDWNDEPRDDVARSWRPQAQHVLHALHREEPVRVLLLPHVEEDGQVVVVVQLIDIDFPVDRFCCSTSPPPASRRARKTCGTACPAGYRACQRVRAGARSYRVLGLRRSWFQGRFERAPLFPRVEELAGFHVAVAAQEPGLWSASRQARGATASPPRTWARARRKPRARAGAAPERGPRLVETL